MSAVMSQAEAPPKSEPSKSETAPKADAAPPEAQHAPSPVPARSLEQPTVLERLISVGVWCLALSVFFPVLPALTVLTAIFGPDRTLPLQRFYAGTQVRSTFCRWRTVVDPRVSPQTAYLFAHNHTNHFDHVLMHNATPHFKQGVELEEHFKIPVYGWFMKTRGGIPIRRGQKGQTPEVLAHMRSEIDKGHAILVFPEGTRTTDGRIGRFRTGSFFIARDLGIPVCPVTVTGAYDFMRKGSLMLRPTELTVYVDAPIETKGLTDEQVVLLAKQVEAVVAGRMDDYWRARGWKG